MWLARRTTFCHEFIWMSKNRYPLGQSERRLWTHTYRNKAHLFRRRVKPNTTNKRNIKNIKKTTIKSCKASQLTFERKRTNAEFCFELIYDLFIHINANFSHFWRVVLYIDRDLTSDSIFQEICTLSCAHLDSLIGEARKQSFLVLRFLELFYTEILRGHLSQLPKKKI